VGSASAACEAELEPKPLRNSKEKEMQRNKMSRTKKGDVPGSSLWFVFPTIFGNLLAITEHAATHLNNNRSAGHINHH